MKRDAILNVSSPSGVRGEANRILCILASNLLPYAFGDLILLVGCQEEHPALKLDWWGVAVVICLERGADCFHNGPADATAVPKPHNLLSHLNPDWLYGKNCTFPVPAHPGHPDKMAVKWLYVFRVFLLQKLETLKRFKGDGNRFLAHDLYWAFLPRDAMLARYMLALCLSVCLSVTSRCSTKTAKHRITQTTPHDSSGILFFLCQRS